MGLNELSSASCVFMSRNDNGGDTFVLVNGNGILVLSTSKQGSDFFVNAFRSCYESRVSNDIEWFLGVKIRWLFNIIKRFSGVELSQPIFKDGILRRFSMTNARPVNTQMLESFWTDVDSEADKSAVNEHFYLQIIASLFYLALHTRLDILPAVSILSRFEKAPTAYCHRAANHILRFLRETYSYVVKY